MHRSRSHRWKLNAESKRPHLQLTAWSMTAKELTVSAHFWTSSRPYEWPHQHNVRRYSVLMLTDERVQVSFEPSISNLPRKKHPHAFLPSFLSSFLIFFLPPLFHLSFLPFFLPSFLPTSYILPSFFILASLPSYLPSFLSFLPSFLLSFFLPTFFIFSFLLSFRETPFLLSFLSPLLSWS